MYYIVGVLITGGSQDIFPSTAELYVPSTGESCTLPKLPDQREFHTGSEGGLICGGDGSPFSCLLWSPDTGTWEEAIARLDDLRYEHVSWTPISGNGTYLMGGADWGTWSGTWGTTLVTSDGSQEPGFTLKHETM